MEFGKNVYQAARHPIDTAENIGSVGLGYMEKAGKAIGLPSGQGYEKYADAVNQMVMDRYGSIDNFKKTLATDPVGAAADLSAVLTGGSGAMAKIPGLSKAAEIAGTAGRIVDPLNAVTQPLKIGATVAKEAIGHATGAGPEAISAAAEAGLEGGQKGKEFRDNMRGKTPIEEPVNQGMAAIENIVSGKNADYKAGMAQAGLTDPIAPRSFHSIAQAIRDAGQIDKFDIHPGVLKANNDIGHLVSDFLNEPSYHTVEGLDALKQAIGDYNRSHGLEGTKAGQVANTYYAAVKGAIERQAPRYAAVMEQYGEAKSILGDLQKAFSLPANERKLATDTALRKLQSVMRNNANTNWGYRTALLKHLEENGAPNIKYALAGQALNAGAPRGLAKIGVALGGEIGAGLVALFTGHPGIAAGALAAAGLTSVANSPRIMGELAHKVGQTARITNKIPVRTLNQMGRIDQLPAMQNRGGAINRALRATKRK